MQPTMPVVPWLLEPVPTQVHPLREAVLRIPYGAYSPERLQQLLSREAGRPVSLNELYEGLRAVHSGFQYPSGEYIVIRIGPNPMVGERGRPVIMAYNEPPPHREIEFEDAARLVQSGQITRWERSVSQEGVPTNNMGIIRIVLVGADGNRYTTIARYVPESNMIYPPRSY